MQKLTNDFKESNPSNPDIPNNALLRSQQLSTWNLNEENRLQLILPECSNRTNLIKKKIVQNDTHFVKNFIKTLQEKSTFENKKISNLVNLIEILTPYKQREEILHILKKYKDEDLSDLEKSFQNKAIPVFFEKIFELAKIYKKNRGNQQKSTRIY